jgi:hypothetical protein
MVSMPLVVVHVIAAASLALAHVAFTPRGVRAAVFVFIFVAAEPPTHVVARAIEPAAVVTIVIVVVAAVVTRVLRPRVVATAVVAIAMVAVALASDRLGSTTLDLGSSRSLELRLLERSDSVLATTSGATVLTIVAWHCKILPLLDGQDPATPVPVERTAHLGEAQPLQRPLAMPRKQRFKPSRKPQNQQQSVTSPGLDDRKDIQQDSNQAVEQEAPASRAIESEQA